MTLEKISHIPTTTLADLPIHLRDRYVLDHGFLAAVLGTQDDSEVRDILLGKPSRSCVTGFGVTGRFHFGSSLVIDTTRLMGEVGHNVHVYLSGVDTRVKPMDENEKLVSDGMYRYLIQKFGSTPNIKLHPVDEPPSKSHIGLLDQAKIAIEEDQYFQAYGRKLTDAERDAVLDMACAINAHSSDTLGTLVLLGIDEMPNAIFTRLVATLLGLPKPTFLLSRTVVGTDGKKMGKSRPQYSMIMSENPQEALQKFDDGNIRKDGLCIGCPRRHVVKFSQFSQGRWLRDCSSCDTIFKQIIYSELSSDV